MSSTKQEELRRQFPFFREYPQWIFMENAGGSQVPSSVIDAISRYYSRSYAQLGGNYDQSDQAVMTVKKAHDFCLDFVNGTDIGEVVLGSSTTQMMHTLSHALNKLMKDDDEIILTNLAHEANYGAWTKIRGKVLEWKVHHGVHLDDLEKLLSDRTRIVAFPHVNNLVGEILDVPTITALVHQRCPRARVIVDGVAYAPHRAIDVRQWNVDFYVFSLYKVYGPHMAVLYGSNAAWQELIDASAGPNHFFIPQNNVRYQYELGCLSHESCAGVLGIQSYLKLVVDAPDDQPVRTTIEQAFEKFSQFEQPLIDRLLNYLWKQAHITVLGPATTNNRLPTVSFISSRFSSKEIVEHLHQHHIACRHGHMYAYRLLDDLQVDLQDGVVRLSAVHYNTVAEVEKCIEALDEIFAR